MCSRIPTNPSTVNCSAADDRGPVDRFRQAIADADAIIIGAGAGMSASAGLTYSGRRFERLFGDFIARYHFSDMYTAGFYPYDTPEERWAYWSRHIYANRYDSPAGRPYRDLLELIGDIPYFVITTNVDHQFQLAGFDKCRLFYTQGDYGLWQCSVPCRPITYDNEDAVRRMVAEQKDQRIPSVLLPRCPLCSASMTMNLRVDTSFVEDTGWHAASGRYAEFLRQYEGKRLLFMELGVGGNTPGIIKYPFWRMAAENPRSVYVCVNRGEAVCPPEIASRSLCLNEDIGRVLKKLLV